MQLNDSHNINTLLQIIQSSTNAYERANRNIIDYGIGYYVEELGCECKTVLFREIYEINLN
jgi:hypothetical protein